MTIKAIATARVTLTIEIDINSTWGETSHISQVFDQATTEAKNAVQNTFKNRCKIIGEPKVEAIVTGRTS